MNCTAVSLQIILKILLGYLCILNFIYVFLFASTYDLEIYGLFTENKTHPERLPQRSPCISQRPSYLCLIYDIF